MAARTNESHELRMQNRALYEENARLNDLARMLLGSSHFANFLNEMPDTVPPQTQAPQQAPPQPQQAPKEAQQPRQEFQMQHNAQPNMVMVPNQGMDTSMLNSGWNSGIDMNYGNTPVFAVLEVPEGPALDAEILSGKSSSIPSSEPTKDEAPVMDRPESDTPKESDVGVANPDVEIDESDPAFALFVDSPAPSVPSDDLVFDGVSSEKSAPQYELVVDNSQISTATRARFHALCSSIDAAFERVSSVTSHLQ